MTSIGTRARAVVNPAKEWARNRVKLGVARLGYRLVPLDSDGIRYIAPSHDDSVGLPPGAAGWLTPENPRLRELIDAYESVDSPANVPTQWTSQFLRRNLSLAWFRGDNAYVWQFREFQDSARARLYLIMLDIESRDELGLLKRADIQEDGLFGAARFNYGDRSAVSRDLLDSVNEINYLDSQMGLSRIEDLRVLDIGAGYGRLAHRMVTALPNLTTYHCTDAIAVSTFICEYYLGFRGVDDRASIVPFSEINTGLEDYYDLAVNIHSFSECSQEAIRWWLARVAERNVPWLLIVPNTPGLLGSAEFDGTRRDFLPDVLAAGYELADRRNVFNSPETSDMLGANYEFVLFRRRQ